MDIQARAPHLPFSWVLGFLRDLREQERVKKFTVPIGKYLHEKIPIRKHKIDKSPKCRFTELGQMLRGGTSSYPLRDRDSIFRTGYFHAYCAVQNKMRQMSTALVRTELICNDS